MVPHLISPVARTRGVIANFAAQEKPGLAAISPPNVTARRACAAQPYAHQEVRSARVGAAKLPADLWSTPMNKKIISAVLGTVLAGTMMMPAPAAAQSLRSQERFVSERCLEHP